MPIITAPKDVTRRHALLIGTSSYRPGWTDIADGVTDELRKLRELLTTTLRYDSCREVLNANVDELPTTVVNWIRSPDIGPDDLTLVYYTGHGVAQGSQLRLIFPGTPADAPNTAPPASELANWILGTPEGMRSRHVLLLVDTCQSGSGSFEALRIASGIREAAGGSARAGEFHVVAAARSIEDATVGHFVDALSGAIEAERIGNPDEEWLRPDALIDRINSGHGFRSGAQHADITGRGEGYFRFFPNPGWDPRLRVTMDRPQRQRASRRLQERAERTHWNPRSRGVSVDAEPGSFFVGRRRALQELATWVSAAPAGAARLVVGRPGCGKSALLARFAHDPDQRVDLAIHARAKNATALLLELAFGLDLDVPATTTDDELPKAILEALRHRVGRALVVIDALDEADKPSDVAMTLRFLLDGAPGLVLVIGVRWGEHRLSRLAKQLGNRAVTLDLDSDNYWEPEDVREYVRKYLAEAEGSPYQGDAHESLRDEIAHAIAHRAGRSFLVANATAHTLARSASRIGQAEMASLPSSVGEAFDQDFRRFPFVTRDTGRAVLTALAFAEGRGLPPGLWQAVAAALGNRPIDEADIEFWLEAADFFIVEDAEGGTRVYRLYHDEFARHFRRFVPEHSSGASAEDRHRLVTQALAATLGSEPNAWFAAETYLQQYLCVHAEKGRLLDQFAPDPGFLSGSDPQRLHDSVRRALARSPGTVEQAYRLVTLAYHHIRDAIRPADRASQLLLAARQLGEHELADQFAADLDLPWLATWSQMPPDLSLTLARLGTMTDVNAIAIASMDGEQLIAAAHYKQVRLWDLATGIERQPLEHTSYLRSLTTLELKETTLLIAGDMDGGVTCWDLPTGKVRGRIAFGDFGTVLVAAGHVAGVPIVVASLDRSLLLWRLDDESVIREHRDEPRPARIRSVAISSGPVPHVLVGRDDGSIEVHDPLTLETTAILAGDASPVTTLATALDRGVPIALAASHSENASFVWVWDLNLLRLRQRWFVGPGTHSVAVLKLDGGTDVVVTAAIDLAVWNLSDGSFVGRLQGHEGPVQSLVRVTVDGRPHLITGGVDGTIRLWDPHEASKELPEPDPMSAFSAVAVGAVAGKDVAVSARGRGVFEIRDVSTGEVTAVLPVVQPMWIYSMAVTRVRERDCLVFSGEDEHVYRLHLDSMEPMKPLRVAERKNHVAGRPICKFTVQEEEGGKTILVAAGHVPQVRRFNLTTGEPGGKAWTFPEEVRAIAVAGRSVILLTRSSVIVGNCHTPDGTFAYRSEFATNSGWVAIAAAMSGNELFIVAGGWDRTVSLMNGAGGIISTLRLDMVINDLVVDAAGNIFVLGNKGIVALRSARLPRMSRAAAAT